MRGLVTLVQVYGHGLAVFLAAEGQEMAYAVHDAALHCGAGIDRAG